LKNFTSVGYRLTSLVNFCLRRLQPCKMQDLQNFACEIFGLARCEPCIWAIFETCSGVLFSPGCYIQYNLGRKIKFQLRGITKWPKMIFLIKKSFLLKYYAFLSSHKTFQPSTTSRSARIRQKKPDLPRLVLESAPLFLKN
jgi:hypothetical protein